MSRNRSDSERPSVRARTRATTSAGRPTTLGGYGLNSGREGLRVTLPGGEELLLTRRHFLYGLTGVAALAVMGGASYAFDQMQAAEASERVLSVPTTSVFTTEECAYVEAEDAPVKVVHELQLPYGSQVWSSTDATAAVLLPGETSDPLVQVAVLTLADGACTTVLDQAVASAEGFAIYDARACDAGLVWVEANILQDVWRVYQAPLSLGTGGTNPTMGEPHLCAEGGGDWEMPTLAAAGAFAWWQELPRVDGQATDQNSLLRRVRFGSPADAEPETVLESEGRMACAPTATSTGVCCTPRANTDLVNYQLTYVDAADGAVRDALILPSSMRPMEAGFGRTGFMFCFDGIYDYGGGIAQLGTYVPVDAESDAGDDPVQAAARYGAAEWFRFPRTPTAAPCWCGPYFMVKATNAVVGVNLQAREYFALDVHDGASDFGDHLGSTGMNTRMVTFSNIDYTPLNGTPEKYSLVRVWST